MQSKQTKEKTGERDPYGKQDKPGPRPETLKFEGHWHDAVKMALHKKRPADGWPKMPRK